MDLKSTIRAIGSKRLLFPVGFLICDYNYIILCFRLKYTTGGCAVWPFSRGELFVDDFRVGYGIVFASLVKLHA